MRQTALFDEEFFRRRGVKRQVLEQVILLAIEVAREGREGRKVGTIFVVGDTGNVLQRSRALILDPLAGHPDEQKRIDHPGVRETLKELAQLDGAFLITSDGIAHSACCYINATTEGLDLPLGLGSRHVAAASVTAQTRAVAVVVSESSIVRIFDEGELVSEIIPEVWMLGQYTSQVSGPTACFPEQNLTVVNKQKPSP